MIGEKEGIGFITPDGGGEDYLVHFSEIQGAEEGAFRSLGEGEKVEYELKPDPKNPGKSIACKVTGPGGGPVQGKGKGGGGGGKGKGGGGKGKGKGKGKKGKDKSGGYEY